jgi:hypothetical protein
MIRYNPNTLNTINTLAAGENRRAKVFYKDETGLNEIRLGMIFPEKKHFTICLGPVIKFNEPMTLECV